VDAVVTVYTT